MRAADRDRVRILLDARREEAHTRLAAAAAGLATIAGAREAANADDEHDPEGATLAAEWSRLTGIRDGVEQELREIESAVTRIADEAFGTCVECGEDIPVERLLVRPSATMCVSCAEKAGR